VEQALFSAHRDLESRLVVVLERSAGSGRSTSQPAGGTRGVPMTVLRPARLPAATPVLDVADAERPEVALVESGS
jgi:hypothetical protein